MKILSAVTKLSVFVGIVLLLFLFAYAIFGDKVFEKPSPLVGTQAPDFRLNLFTGGQLKLSELKGKAVLLNFWASWCGPCRSEAPALEASWRKYRDKPVVFLGINVWDDKSNALRYIDSFGGGYLNGLDPKGEIAVEYGVAGVPETYFIDPSGKIVDKYTGQLTKETIDYFLERALSPSKQNELTKR
ncbi:MAG: TlpA family protein disulfide reductase [Deltaproteobacteria bacterium]|nr:TlpA family protein disulfide reductase [Deltaproteobacteria bacterium]